MFMHSPIKWKFMGGVLLTSGIVLVLTCGTFLAYELVTFRRAMVENLSTLARVTAANSTAALAFDNQDDATRVLSALAAEPHVVASGLYDRTGALFARYPPSIAVDLLPAGPDRDGYRFSRTGLTLYEPVVNGNRRLGTVYLASDLNALYRRLELYGILIGGVLIFSCLIALGLSLRLQHYISRPVMALVNTAAAISTDQDYSRRAARFGDDELGRLTDAFNDMLARIEEQDRAVNALNATLEQRVHERTVALEAANKELEAFSYSVSHDLRAPLRAITGFSRILIDDHLPALSGEAADYLQRVAKGAQQMGQLVDDLLAFARLGRSPVRRTQVDPAEIARQVVEDLKGELNGREVRIAVDTVPSCEADPALLKQVYANLVSNALKFTRNRQNARIEIGCDRPDGSRPAYFVRDNGVGFDMRYADKLFGVFQRLHRAEDYEGTGVGLAIVARVVTRHGGRVWAESAPEGGACFHFTIGDSQ